MNRRHHGIGAFKAISIWHKVQELQEPMTVVTCTPDGDWRSVLKVSDSPDVIRKKLSQRDYEGNRPYERRQHSEFIIVVQDECSEFRFKKVNKMKRFILTILAGLRALIRALTPWGYSERRDL